jgi:hypothetical protein
VRLSDLSCSRSLFWLFKVLHDTPSRQECGGVRGVATSGHDKSASGRQPIDNIPSVTEHSTELLERSPRGSRD